tara:strand:+ start:302 stop:787 length:486 start_codon:yes stop_codon:yes gene_type:complete
MAGFHTKTFIQHDDYMTPKSAWENIKQYIPKNKVIWEAFMGDGKSGQYLSELGFNVIHNDNDFFENNEGDIVVSNPPFTKKKEILQRLKELDKAFILLMPQNTLNNNYIREFFNNEIQIIIPRKRIQFIKNGEDGHEKKCNFDCFYYCYKIGFDNDIVFLN